MTNTCEARRSPHEPLTDSGGPVLATMPPDPLDWLPGSPFLKPDWRWRRARWLCASGRRRGGRIGDAWVGRAGRVLGRNGGPGRADPAVAAAAALARTASPARDLLEAYLLTELPLDEAAARAGLSAAAAEAYHALFYCVRDRPAARDWLTLQVLRPDPLAGFRPDEVG